MSSMVDTRASSSSRDLILDATLRCFARHGVAKTTLDDVVAEAGISRATIYRTFEGGRDGLIREVLAREVGRLFRIVDAELAGAETLEDLVVRGLYESFRFLNSHEALSTVIAVDTDLVLPQIAVHGLGDVIKAVQLYSAPHLCRFVSPAAAAALAELCVRVVFSYSLHPSEYIDVTDEDDLRRFVASHLLPSDRSDK